MCFMKSYSSIATETPEDTMSAYVRYIDRFQNSHDEFTAYNPLEAECYADFIIETLGALSVMVYINDKPYYHRNKTSKKFYN